MDVIKVSDVWKKFRIYHDRGLTLKEKILFRNRNKFEDRWVLKGINLNIKKGETVGLIGENGSGKSTLLKLLTKIIYPNRGQIEIYGKVSSLLELGAGFHPDMTGRENIYTNASIFGLTKSEIDKKLDDIIAFSELEEFIDNPVRTYSSGMYMRLAFSVAINVEPDILLIDEILAVGDANFQKKCFDKLKEFKKINTTIVIVTHDLGSVEKLCDKAVWVHEGVIQDNGEPKKVVDAYLQFMNQKREDIVEREYSKEEQERSPKSEELEEIRPGEAQPEQSMINNQCEQRWGSREVEIIDVRMINENSETKHFFTCGEKVTIQISYKKHKDMDEYVFGIGIFNQDGISCYGTNTCIDKIKINKINLQGTVEFIIEELLLVEGRYSLDVAIHAEDGRAYDYYRNVYEFEIGSTIKDVGICRLKHEWNIM
ncbi:MAG: ABC transporter ATP-binding protein [Tepidanaerobacteraceae bacterium]|jgi:ABC-2 type transport system ATP-binding protein|nr:ABC transporter ATP-binding protein [Tepidanaerobacteraceae bacterium]